MPQINPGQGSRFLGALRLSSIRETLSGTKVLTTTDPTIQHLDPGGAARNVDLPAEADSIGLVFIIANEADAAEIITVRNDAAGTIVTPTQGESAIVWCDGVSWRGIVGADT